MNRIYLGDSYDLVKRFFAEVLGPIAPLYAHPKFVPSSIRDSYTAITTIPVMEKAPDAPFGILLDPDTGVPMLTGSYNTTAHHATLQFIVAVAREIRPKYIACFDQSYHRKHELSKERQRQKKREFLRASGLYSFYYVSHAPFLFVADERSVLDSLVDRLILGGVPKCRFDGCEL